MLHYEKMGNSARGIGAVYMCFNGTGIWGGETISKHKGSVVLGLFFGIFQLLVGNVQLDIYIWLNFNVDISLKILIRKYIPGE